MKMDIFVPFLVVLLVSPAVFARDITVGGSSGWTDTFDYSSWTSGQTFNVGDNLVFNYGNTHSVYEVRRADYDSCNTGNPINTYSPSPTNINLPSTGSRYFICPTSNHCAQGMKLAVNVVAAGSPTPRGSPPPPGSTPSPNSPPAPPGTSAPPPPPPGSSASIYGGMSSLIVVSLAALYVFMG